jgi:hypothetical protein
MSEAYKKLILDPRCLKPAHEIKNKFVYIDSLEAVSEALEHPSITESEKNILEVVKKEIRRNRFAI